MTDAEIDALDAKLASQIGDDIQVIFNHEYLFKQSRAAISALRADLAAIREAALREAETVVRQVLVNAAYVYGSEPMKAKSAMFKAEAYATNAILALIGKANSMIGEKK